MSLVCETVKDLVPVYLDGACSKETEAFVKRHLKKCKKCALYCDLCARSEEAAEKRIRLNKNETDLIYAPDNGYDLIARRIGKSMLVERIAIISAAVAAIVTTVIIFKVKSATDKKNKN